jgi:hypothetical protein
LKSCRFAPILCCLSASVVFADVLRDQDNGPLTGIFGVPDSTEGAKLLDAGLSALDLSVTYASHSIFDARPTEALYLDGETSRFELRYRIGINDRFELGVEVPYVQHRGGQLDSFIDKFHNTFGMPEGLRPGRVHDLLDFRYADLTGLRLIVRDEVAGFGDARLFGGMRLLTSDKHRMALRFGVKVPTGDSSKLLGSGGTDISVGLAGDLNTLFNFTRLTGFYRLHAIHLGQPHFLADRYREWVGFASLGTGYQLTERVQLLLQGAMRSGAYDSVIRSLGDTSTTITFGSNIRINSDFALSMGISEDADVTSAPDVAFQVELRYRSSE